MGGSKKKAAANDDDKEKQKEKQKKKKSKIRAAAQKYMNKMKNRMNKLSEDYISSEEMQANDSSSDYEQEAIGPMPIFEKFSGVTYQEEEKKFVTMVQFLRWTASLQNFYHGNIILRVLTPLRPMLESAKVGEVDLAHRLQLTANGLDLSEKAQYRPPSHTYRISMRALAWRIQTLCIINQNLIMFNKKMVAFLQTEGGKYHKRIMVTKIPSQLQEMHKFIIAMGLAWDLPVPDLGSENRVIPSPTAAPAQPATAPAPAPPPVAPAALPTIQTINIEKPEMGRQPMNPVPMLQSVMPPLPPRLRLPEPSGPSIVPRRGSRAVKSAATTRSKHPIQHSLPHHPTPGHTPAPAPPAPAPIPQQPAPVAPPQAPSGVGTSSGTDTDGGTGTSALRQEAGASVGRKKRKSNTKKTSKSKPQASDSEDSSVASEGEEDEAEDNESNRLRNKTATAQLIPKLKRDAHKQFKGIQDTLEEIRKNETRVYFFRLAAIGTMDCCRSIITMLSSKFPEAQGINLPYTTQECNQERLKLPPPYYILDNLDTFPLRLRQICVRAVEPEELK